MLQWPAGKDSVDSVFLTAIADLVRVFDLYIIARVPSKLPDLKNDVGTLFEHREHLQVTLYAPLFSLKREHLKARQLSGANL